MDFTNWVLSEKTVGDSYSEFLLVSDSKHFFEHIKIRVLNDVTVITGEWGSVVLNKAISPKYTTVTNDSLFNMIEYDAREGYKEFDGKATAKALQEEIDELPNNYTEENVKKYAEQLTELISHTDDYFEYCYRAFRGELDWSSEDIPCYFDYKPRIKIYVEAFNEINKRLNLC